MFDLTSERIQHGTYGNKPTTTGNDGQPIGAGDVILTRKNNSHLGVANRLPWPARQLGNDGTLWAKETDSGLNASSPWGLSAEYAGEYTQQEDLIAAPDTRGSDARIGARSVMAAACRRAGRAAVDATLPQEPAVRPICTS